MAKQPLSLPSLFLFFFFLIFSTIFSLCKAAESEVEEEHAFTYGKINDAGPSNWGNINPKWKVCNQGKLQSPIDLVDSGLQIIPAMGDLRRQYKPANATVKNRGHDIVVLWKGMAGKININGTDYMLVQCHWHSPSEHLINGLSYDLELHMVHESSKGELAVIGIIYKVGKADPFLTMLIEHIRQVSDEHPLGTEEKSLGVINPRDISFGSRMYYKYIGSLTVPPCTEGVLWTILKKVRTVSKEQVRELREAVHDGYESNARPTQQLDGRTIRLYTANEI